MAGEMPGPVDEPGVVALRPIDADLMVG